MKYETIEDLKRVELELAEVDRMLDQEKNAEVVKAITEVAGVAAGGAAGGAGGIAAVYFAGLVGFSGAGITSGLAAIGALVGGGMLAGIALVAAAPVVLAGGGFFAARYLRNKKFNEARAKLREHAQARREFLENLMGAAPDSAFETVVIAGSSSESS
jgi:hypothetical protein